MSNQSTVTASSMHEEVLEGLAGEQKSLPSKYFYDERGSQLFEQITRLDEYYLSRTEIAIMNHHMAQIVRQTGNNLVLVELGSGSSRKTRLLLDQHPGITGYVPVDISEQYLAGVVKTLKGEYPGLPIKPVCADYTLPFQLPSMENGQSALLYYPGSTIGNFRPEQARGFLAQLARIVGQQGGLLIGVDLVKDRNVLEAAYNDERGITAQFNKNILLHINRRLSADFNPGQFEHNAFYNQEEERIEMHLVSTMDQEVTVAGNTYPFRMGETVHTENSYKYTLAGFDKLVNPWFTVEKVWTDENNWFSLNYLKRKSPLV